MNKYELKETKLYLGSQIMEKLLFINENIEFLRDHIPLRIDDMENETTHIYFIDVKGKTFNPSLNFENYINFKTFCEYFTLRNLVKLNKELDSKIKNIKFYRGL